jgi:hypothetical protein
MSEPVTTTTSVFIIPSPLQCVIAGAALGFGATLGYKFACASSEAVSSGLDKSKIKDRVKALMEKREKKNAENEVNENEVNENEVDIDDDLDDEDDGDDNEDNEENGEDDGDEDEGNVDEGNVEQVKKSAKKARQQATA